VLCRVVWRTFSPSHTRYQIALPPFFVPLTPTLKDINVAFITQYLVKPPPTVPSAATRAVASGAKAAAVTMAVAAVVAAMSVLA
jgi:hypothetical protein